MGAETIGLLAPTILSGIGGFFGGGDTGGERVPIPGLNVPAAFAEAQNAIRNQLGIAQDYQASDLVVPGMDVSGAMGAARIPGAPSGLVGYFPGFQEANAAEIRWPGLGVGGGGGGGAGTGNEDYKDDMGGGPGDGRGGDEDTYNQLPTFDDPFPWETNEYQQLPLTPAEPFDPLGGGGGAGGAGERPDEGRGLVDSPIPEWDNPFMGDPRIPPDERRGEVDASWGVADAERVDALNQTAMIIQSLLDMEGRGGNV